MRKQLDLLAKCEWDVLVILDACRADYFIQEFSTEFESILAVESPAVCTPSWLTGVAPFLSKALYFTANPVVDRTFSHWRTIKLWKFAWSHCTDLQIPSVHPMAVSGAVLAYQNLGLLKDQKVVVHFIQPHSPFIGNEPLSATRWGAGNIRDGMTVAMKKLARPQHLIKTGAITWEELQSHYLSNLHLVMRATHALIDGLPRRNIVITSDHGELLGEHNRYGHECNWRFPLLRQVPWVGVEGGGTERSVKKKLEDLGYV